MPTVCGRYHCRALEHWTPQRWEGQYRQAMARHAAGVPLQPLDREAIRRAKAGEFDEQLCRKRFVTRDVHGDGYAECDRPFGHDKKCHPEFVRHVDDVDELADILGKVFV